MKLVTIFMPTRNRRGLLTRAVDSVLTQTHTAFELIIVDDASTDDSTDYLAALERRDSRVRVLRHTAPRGAPAARNMAITQARGEFVTGLDDDDQFEPARIELFVAHWAFLSQAGLQPSFLYAQDLDLIDNRVATRSAKRGSVHYHHMFVRNEVGNQIFAPTERWREVGLFDETLPAWQDLDLEMRMLARYGVAHLLDVATYRFDMTPRPGRISQQGIQRLKEAHRIVSAKHAGSDIRRQQLLYAQMFSRFYGFRPGWRDWAYCLRGTPSPFVIGRLLKASLGTADEAR